MGEDFPAVRLDTRDIPGQRNAFTPCQRPSRRNLQRVQTEVCNGDLFTTVDGVVYEARRALQYIV
jgi:hypothetical protein